ncbi:uncharacterized protein TNCV_2116141 [Trichonephila clavipes]|nr:uncharacterized protein TNCV_2116141 [Trichonephila clavipes]
MGELNLDQAPQDTNKEFQLERVCLQTFVAATDPGCKKELIRSGSCCFLKNIIESKSEDGLPNIVIRRDALLFIRDGNPLQAKDKTSFPEENTSMPYSGFEPEPTRLQAEGHIHYTDWATSILDDLIPFGCNPIPSNVSRHHSKRKRRLVSVNSSKRNGRRICPPARRFAMIRTDTEAYSEVKSERLGGELLAQLTIWFPSSQGFLLSRILTTAHIVSDSGVMASRVKKGPFTTD